MSAQKLFLSSNWQQFPHPFLPFIPFVPSSLPVLSHTFLLHTILFPVLSHFPCLPFSPFFAFLLSHLKFSLLSFFVLYYFPILFIVRPIVIPLPIPSSFAFKLKQLNMACHLTMIAVTLLAAETEFSVTGVACYYA